MKDEPDVSLKINGKHVKEKPHSVQESTPSKEFSIIDWNERRAVEKEAAAERERPGLPLKKSRKKKPRPNPGENRTKKKQPFSLYFISLTAGAAALGLLFGIMLLQFVSAGSSSNGAAVEEENEEDPPPITADFNDTLTTYFVQAGAFTKKDKGVEMQTTLLERGFPGVLTYDGEFYYLFSGVSFRENNSKQLMEYFQEEGIEVYEKTRSVPDPEEKEGAEQVTEALLQAKQLLMDVTDGTLEKEEKTKVSDKLTKFLENTKSWEEEEFTNLRDVMTNLEKEWSKEQEEDGTSDLQESLIEAVLYYEEAVYAHNGVEKEKQ